MITRYTMSILYIWVVFLVIADMTADSKALQIINQPSDIIAIEGTLARLKCGVIGEKPISITWNYNGKVVRFLNSNRMTISNDGTLKIFRILPSDAGTYFCTASSKFGSVASRNATVHVTLAVLKQTFEVIPRGGYYKRNEIVVLYCKPPYGRPKPLVKWYKNGKKIQRLIIDSYGTLTITSFEPADEGYYHCEAHSVAGIRRSPETVVSLLVPPSFFQKPVDVTTRVGSVATFYCFAEGSPQPTILWQKGNIILSAGETSGRMRVLEDATLEIFDVQKMDKGTYTCIVENKMNKQQMMSDATLHVLYAPTITSTSNNETAYENNKIILRCKVDGFPAPTVSWFTDDDVRSNSDFAVSKNGNEHLLTITNVKDIHEGQYICEAKNKLGIARKELFLNVGSWSCSPTEFMCNKPRHCIPKDWVCDLDNDCGDNTDEENCVDVRRCSSLYDFSCSNGRCIPWSMTCDGDNDCKDGSDEHQDSCFHKCNSSVFFTCRNWKCIPKQWRCDNEDDCKDGSDEMGCTGSPPSCKSDEFQCVMDKDKKCIPKYWRCDKEKDCADSSDEKNCGYIGCGPGSFTFSCHNGDCIPLPWKCDGESDCRDGSDELTCEKHVQTSPTRCNKGDHLCDGVWCIQNSWVCDGDRDCRDGTDERNCDQRPPKSLRCRQDQHECGETCIFGNQICDGNYDCPDRSDETMCQEYILYSKQESINKLDLHNLPSKVIISSLRNAVALDIDLSEGLIYWTDIVYDNIQRAMLNGPNNRTVETIIQFNLESPEGIAIDWVGRKLYWTDLLPGKIEVAELDGKNRAVLISENVTRPRAIVVHPKERHLFWTEWGENAQIEKCGMNGDPTTRQILVEKNIEWPNGLAIDYQTERLWWVDAKLASIESINLDGTDRKTIVSIKDGSLGHPFSLAVFGESIFWTEWNKKLIYQSTKMNPNDKIIVKRIEGDLSPMDIKVVHPHQQPKGINPCGLDNGRCSHLCLLSPKKTHSFSCFCPTGMRLSKDKKTCTIEDNQPYILFANSVGIFYSDVSLKQVSPLLAGISGGAAALDVDVQNKYIYWSNAVNDTIDRVSLSHIGAVETIINTNLKLVEGIAFDWINRKLYWTDGTRRVIEVTDPEETSLRLTLVKGLDKPRAIVLHPKTRYVYWTDWGKNPKIERCGMNGDFATRETVIKGDIVYPNGLAIDYVEEKLWWAEATLDKIETANLDGTMRRAVVKEPSIHPFGLVVYNNSILWTDWIENTIYKADKLAGKIFFSKDVGSFRPTGIRVIHGQMHRSEPNPCGRKRKGCSHLCLLSPKPPSYSCHCPNGMSLLPDGKSCL